MNEALSAAQACIAGAMNALAIAGVADTARAVEDDLTILKAQTLLRRAMSTLGMPFDAGAGRHPMQRILMDSVMLDGTTTIPSDTEFTLSLPELDSDAATGSRAIAT